MNTKILGFTVTDDSHQKDIYIVNFDESKITEDTKLPINFKFGIFNYKKGDTFTADFIFKNDNGNSTKHHLSLDDIIANDDAELKKGGDYYSSQFWFNVPLVIKQGNVTCKISLKQNNKEIDSATTYFALRKL